MTVHSPPSTHPGQGAPKRHLPLTVSEWKGPVASCELCSPLWGYPPWGGTCGGSCFVHICSRWSTCSRNSQRRRRHHRCWGLCLGKRRSGCNIKDMLDRWTKCPCNLESFSRVDIKGLRYPSQFSTPFPDFSRQKRKGPILISMSVLNPKPECPAKSVVGKCTWVVNSGSGDSHHMKHIFCTQGPQVWSLVPSSPKHN